MYRVCIQQNWISKHFIDLSNQKYSITWFNKKAFLQPAYEVSRRLCFQRYCPSVNGDGVGGSWVSGKVHSEHILAIKVLMQLTFKLPSCLLIGCEQVVSNWDLNCLLVFKCKPSMSEYLSLEVTLIWPWHWFDLDGWPWPWCVTLTLLITCSHIQRNNKWNK